MSLVSVVFVRENQMLWNMQRCITDYHTKLTRLKGEIMISNFDYEKIEDIANLAIDDLYSIKEAANEHDLHSESLKENLEEVRECIDFMKLFTESEGKP